jgi:hypothetical protein
MVWWTSSQGVALGWWVDAPLAREGHPSILLLPTKWSEAQGSMTIFPKSGKWLVKACEV